MTIIEHTITRPLIIPSATSMDWTDIDSIGYDADHDDPEEGPT